MSQPLKIETQFSASPSIQDNHRCAVVFPIFGFFFFALNTIYEGEKDELSAHFEQEGAIVAINATLAL